MGSSNSRLGSRSTPSNSRSTLRRSSLSSLFCAGSLPLELEDHPDESLPASSQNLAANCHSSLQQSSVNSGLETGSSSVSVESGVYVGSSSNADPVKDGSPKPSTLKCQPSTESLPADVSVISLDDQAAGNPHSHGETIGATSFDGNTAGSDSPLTSDALPGFILSVGEQGLIGMGVLLVDVVSIHRDTLSSSIADISNREARRNSRRMYRDALSRISSNRSSDSSTFLSRTSHADDPRSHDRWLLDYSGDLHYDGVGHESRYSSRRNDRHRGRRWQSRYEMSDRFHDVHDEQDWESSSCPIGLHPRGSCPCNSSFTAEEPSSLTGISPFIIVADALFEVIDEIRRHQMSLSLSMLTLPAPESIVDSFPLKNHKKLCGTERGTSDTQQCHICLIDYEEDDKIRVLPCSHEYHMSCVDKWLKEIHGVCPLCREDVSKGGVEDSTSNPEIVIPSL
ncbi:RING/U-box superfamily protein [Euphorbia peplus]|nr:RING/U-box superfamily protein [Euphorbia peplus]